VKHLTARRFIIFTQVPEKGREKNFGNFIQASNCRKNDDQSEGKLVKSGHGLAAYNQPQRPFCSTIFVVDVD
jgi:hypothetical protein